LREIKGYVRLFCFILVIVIVQTCIGKDFSETQTDEAWSKSDVDKSSISLGEEAFRSRDLKKARDIFENMIKSDSKNAQVQYFLGLVEYEDGNLEKAKVRFQIAYDCLSPLVGTAITSIGDRKVLFEMSDNYEALVYYKDGWYLRSKNPDSLTHSLDIGSNYRIEISPKSKRFWMTGGIIGSIIALSFLSAR
jgi:tetratricopeptide (TPR) repeat protein